MNIIEYDRTWCDYLTPCPNNQIETEDRYIMVGSYECYSCKYFNSFGPKTDNNETVKCDF